MINERYNKIILNLLKGETVQMEWDDCGELIDYIYYYGSDELQELTKSICSIETTIGTIRTLDVFLKELQPTQ